MVNPVQTRSEPEPHACPRPTPSHTLITCMPHTRLKSHTINIFPPLVAPSIPSKATWIMQASFYLATRPTTSSCMPCRPVPIINKRPCLSPPLYSTACNPVCTPCAIYAIISLSFCLCPTTPDHCVMVTVNGNACVVDTVYY